MNRFEINISPFQFHHQADIDNLMATIAEEFIDNIFSAQSKTITEVSLLPTDKYWVAHTNDTVIGTIGFSALKDNNIVLKRMFLSKPFRGKGVSKMLLDTLINFAIHRKVSNIFLGTMSQFKVAQKFYEKNNFTKIPQSLLPIDFPINPVDTIFYKREIN
jgi:GNAT superfamily N-acetyltransferase